jgi:hypothetical protein
MIAIPRLYFASRQAYKRHLASEVALAGAPFRKGEGAQSEDADWKGDSVDTSQILQDAETGDPEGYSPPCDPATDEGCGS